MSVISPGERRELARELLRLGAVLFDPERKFELVSGRRSPVYVDCRRLISFPEVRDRITEQFARIVRQEIGLESVEVVAGGETAGIPFAALLAERLGKPMIYVRKEPKGHGRSAQIEGVLEPGQHVLLVEDLVTDGGSKLRFAEGIARAGGILEHCLTVFEYYSERAGLRRARETLHARGIELYSLVDWDDILAAAQEGGELEPPVVAQILDFLRGF